MSERLYALVLRLYPRAFRRAHGEEALQLLRDRLRHERGAVLRLRLWLDLLFDFSVSLPRAWHSEAALLRSALPQRADDGPRFGSLEQSGAPRPGAFVYGTALATLLFAGILIAIGTGGTPSFLNLPQSTQQPSSAAAISPRETSGTVAAGSAGLSGSGVQAANAVGSARETLATKKSRAEAAVQPELQAPVPQNATKAILEAFATHNIVLYGEVHDNQQEYDWLCQLVRTPEFANRVEDIVVEFGNALYQSTVDQYISGGNGPFDQVQKAWRNKISLVGPVSPVYEGFYKAVREANLGNHGRHPLRIVLGGAPGDWSKIHSHSDVAPLLAERDHWYAQVVEQQVLAKHHRALLVMGAGHFLRRDGPSPIEAELRAAGANPYLVVFGTNAISPTDTDPRFKYWPAPSIVPVANTWLGALPALPVITGGAVAVSSLSLAAAADAMLYLGPCRDLTDVSIPGSELAGTSYGQEIMRRAQILTGHSVDLAQYHAKTAQCAASKSP